MSTLSLSTDSKGPYYMMSSNAISTEDLTPRNNESDSPVTPGNLLEKHLSSSHVQSNPNSNTDDGEILIIDQDDEENFKILTEWLLKKADIIPSLTRKYAQIFLNEGVGSVSRLHKRVKKDHDFLSKVGIKDDDIEEIVLALNRQEALAFKQQAHQSPGKDQSMLLNSSHSIYLDNAHSGSGSMSSSSHHMSSKVHVLDLTSPTNASNNLDPTTLRKSGGAGGFMRPLSARSELMSSYLGSGAAASSSASSGLTSAAVSATAQANVIQALTDIASARARGASVVVGDENASVTISPFFDGSLPDVFSSSGSTAGGENGGDVFGDNGTSMSGGVNNTAGPQDIVTLAPMTAAEVEVIQKLKRFKQSTYVKPASPEAVAEATNVINNLKTAIETKMEAAVTGVLNTMCMAMEKSTSGEMSRAYFKAEASIVVIEALNVFVETYSVCENAMMTIALLCRYSDENKASVCLENAKALGVSGAVEAIAAVLIKHANDMRVLTAACDAIRCMCLLDSNRVRFGEANVCEIIARALGMKRFVDNPELTCWICRALGHLACNNNANRERLGNVGACETIISALQVHQANSNVCTEACWALRNIAPIERNRSRIADEFGPENIISVLKAFYKDPVFVIEAVKALVSFLSDETTDDFIPRLVNAGIIPLLIKSMKKSLEDEEMLCAWIWNLFYFISCDHKLKVKLSGSDVLNVLSLAIEAHAGNEFMAEWGCRTVHNLVTIEGVANGMRAAGLCEMVVSCVQRQAISPAVCGFGCLAIGDLAMEKNNHSRLSDSGACEAVVGSLKRHDNDANVVFQTCHAIHYLAMTDNNVAWIGANGGCDAMTLALIKHTATSVTATRSCLRALGSLGRDEGNMARLHAAGACAALVTALKTHGMDLYTAEYGFRAIYIICADNANVSELGAKGACGLVAAGLQRHVDSPLVVTQACFAVYALAVKMKSDKIHNGNTRKLVTKGTIESVILIMKKFPRESELTRAGALAIASLARVDTNREKLGSHGAVQVVLLGFKTHTKNDLVLTALSTATDRLCQDSLQNKTVFIQGEVVDMLLTSMSAHEKCAALMGESLRALVTLSTTTAAGAAASTGTVTSATTTTTTAPVITTTATCPTKLKQEESFKLYIRGMRLHEKNDVVARWGCNLIYTCAVDETSRQKLGELKACDAVNTALRHHSVSSSDVALWACKSLVALAQSEVNRQRFINGETCTCVIKALQTHQEDAQACEWICAAVVSLSMSESNRIKLGAAGACAALCCVLTKLMVSSEIVTRLACEAIYELCFDESNRHLFAIVGACELIVTTLNTHIHHAQTAQHVCRAITGLAKVSTHYNQNPDLLGAAGACQSVARVISIHMLSSSLVESGCAAIAALCFDGHEKNQNIFAQLSNNSHNNSPEIINSAAGNNSSTNNIHSSSHSSSVKLSSPSKPSLEKSSSGRGSALTHGFIVTKPTPLSTIHESSTVTSTTTATDGSGGVSAVNSSDDHLNIFKLLTLSLQTHRSNPTVCAQACRAARTLSTGNTAVKREFSVWGILPPVVKVLRTHRNVEVVVEHSCWLLANIIAPTAAASATAVSDAESGSNNTTEGGVSVVKDLIDLNLDNKTTAATTTATTATTNNDATSAPAAPTTTATATVSTLPNSTELYRMSSHWDILLSTLQINYQKQSLARWVCAAISVFAEHGQLEHLSLCDTVLTTLTRHMDKEIVLMQALIAIGKLAGVNNENKLRLIRGQALETIDRLLTTYTEGELVCRGVFAALAGLASQSPTVQAKIITFSNLCKALVRFLYAELESEEVAAAGCEAIANIVVKHKINQGKLSGVCNYMADVLEAHYKSNSVLSPVVVREACRAISHLCHVNITNRNKLGASDACVFVPRALKYHLDKVNNSNNNNSNGSSQLQQHNTKVEDSVSFWAVRAIADLAANNPNNQTKLGANGACECLVLVLRSILFNSSRQNYMTLSTATRQQNLSMAKWTCWALGNIIQLTRMGGNGLLVDESTKKLSATSVTARSLATATGVTAAPTQKNSYHLTQAGAAEVMVKLLMQYGEHDQEVAQWGARAVNNMGKSSRSLKLQLTELGAIEVLSDLLANTGTQYTGGSNIAGGAGAAMSITNLTHANSFTGMNAAAGVSGKESHIPPAAQWILSALDTLQSQTSNATTGGSRDNLADRSFSNGSNSNVSGSNNNTVGVAGGNSNNNSMATLTGSSGSLWSDSANATVQAVFGTPTPSAATRRRSSEDMF